MVRLIRKFKNGIIITLLLIIGGFWGAMSWLITGGVFLGVWHFHGWAAAVVASGIAGKATGIMWVAGVAQVANKHCPKFHTFMMKAWNCWRKNWREILAVAFWVTLLVWVIFVL